MEANVKRGHLEVHDERGSYRIPIGRRSRKTLMILDQKEGEYIRSLELDLFTGFVYYCVDNATTGGLSYYYDMSSKKVSRFFIHRYLRLARNHGFTASPEEYEVFEKLPCQEWVTEMEKLPGWKADIRGARDWDALPAAARDYVLWIEKNLGVPVTFFSTGPGREDVILRGRRAR